MPNAERQLVNILVFAEVPECLLAER